MHNIKPKEYPFMPLFYHGRLKGNSDKAWIMKCMCWIPTHDQQKVATEYSKRYLQGKEHGRRDANTWLHKLATQHRSVILKQHIAANDEAPAVPVIESCKA